VAFVSFHEIFEPFFEPFKEESHKVDYVDGKRAGGCPRPFIWSELVAGHHEIIGEIPHLV